MRSAPGPSHRVDWHWGGGVSSQQMATVSEAWLGGAGAGQRVWVQVVQEVQENHWCR